MDDAAYAALLATVESAAIDELGYDRLLAAAIAREDAPTVVFLHLYAGRIDDAIAHVRRISEDAARAVILDLARRGEAQPLWDALAGIAEVRPELLDAIESAVAGWPIAHRSLPDAWLTEIRRGSSHPRHRLVRSVWLQGADVTLLATPAGRESFRSVRTLLVSDTDDAGLAALRDAEFDAVEKLHVSRSVVAPRTIADLVVDESLPRLQRLAFTQLNADRRTHITRREYPQLAPLEMENPLELEYVAAALAGRSTKRPPFDLVFAAIGIESNGLRELARQPALAGIRHLTLDKTRQLDADGLKALADSQHTSALVGLAIDNGRIGKPGVAAILGAPFARSLRHLSLVNHHAGDLGALLDVFDGSPLERLDLGHEELGPETAATLARIRLPRLTHLVLAFNPTLDDDACARVVANPSFGELRELSLLGTGAAVRTARALADNTALTSLESVRLGDDVTDVGARALEGLPQLRRVTRLQLVGVSDVAIEALARSLGLTHGVTNKLLAS
jgi:hypothetical protein